jgi:hypothetical protein
MMPIVDAVTQAWVRATGRRIDPSLECWLDGPAADARGIGANFFQSYAAKHGIALDEAPGLLDTAAPLDPANRMDPLVRMFYERTSSFDIDAWAEWSGLFRPFGELLARMFSRRLGQLNLPLSALDTSRGMSSKIFSLSGTGMRAWVRSLNATGQTIYAGAYSLCTVPNRSEHCVRVVFPLPNGSATVILFPEIGSDGSLTLWSQGRRFGDAGFYFVVKGEGKTWARYVRSMHESIRVYVEGRELRTDHVLHLFGLVFLRIHYRLRLRDAVGSRT